MTKSAGMWNTSKFQSNNNNNAIVESILPSLLGNGISCASYNFSLAGELCGPADPTNIWAGGAWSNNILPNSSMSFGGNAFQVSTQEQEGATMLEMRAYVVGYAYSWRGKTQTACFIVPLLYVALVTAHILYSVWTGWCSSCWGTASAITALALNLEPSNALQNTGAGIRTTRPLEEPFSIRDGAGRLQLVSLSEPEQGEWVYQEHAYA